MLGVGLVERDAGKLDGRDDEKSEKLKLLVRCNAGSNLFTDRTRPSSLPNVDTTLILGFDGVLGVLVRVCLTVLFRSRERFIESTLFAMVSTSFLGYPHL